MSLKEAKMLLAELDVKCALATWKAQPACPGNAEPTLET